MRGKITEFCKQNTLRVLAWKSFIFNDFGRKG